MRDRRRLARGFADLASAKLRAMRAPLAAAGARTVAVLALTLAALASGCGSQEADETGPTPAQAHAALAGSPAPLAALHRQASELLGGGTAAFDARLATLRGRPVVVNAWAHWCHPCRREMPYFARAAVRYGRRVAFLGLNVGDTNGKAQAFLRGHWVPYPSYVDPDFRTASRIGVRSGLPTTVFYDRDGAVAYVHQGPYADEAALIADMKRYAGAA
jgi:cytochrome c biogenesis protein CcmG, thiol:disulfide interchange protein DsbE